MKSNKQNWVQYGKQDVYDLTKEPLYQGFFKMVGYRFRYRKFDGSVSNLITREILERGDAVILLAYDPNRDQVVMIEQLRIAAIESQASPWILELIAGMVDHENESLEEVARREAMEEAGITINRCEKVLSYLASPGGTTEQLHIFVGEVDASQAKGIHGLAEEDEDIRVHVLDRSEAYQLLQDGTINNAASIIALQWLELNYQQLQQRWR